MLSRILLAAPHSRAVATHQAFLTRLGYDVAVCGDGLRCIERLRKDRPDVLILALDLPWGRGEGVLALMADGELPSVPVVLLADSAHPLRLAGAVQAPVRTFLPWPAPPRLLGQAVRGVLSAEPVGHFTPETEARADEWSARPTQSWP
ncbi:MAG TPA: response regulator [Gemmataceae bacterium]|jgi:CheY-like chemotaxis protein|nr:response regulator [Gemmataceae bacterium]